MSTFQLDPNQVALGVPSLGTTQVFTVTTSSVQSTAFGASTTMVRVACSQGFVPKDRAEIYYKIRGKMYSRKQVFNQRYLVL